MQQGFNHMDKLDFLNAYPDARKQAFSMDNIKNGFRATGLVPYNPEEVLGRFTIQLKTPTPPDSQSTNSITHMPSNKRELQKKAKSLKRQLREDAYSPFAPSNSTLLQLLKACETAMDKGLLLAHENQQLQASHEKLIQKRNCSRKQIATEEGLSIQEGQSLLQSRNQADEAIPTVHTEPVPEAEQHPVCAPSQCSDCNIIGHKRNQCPSCNNN